MSRRTFTEEEVFNLELKAHNAGAESGRNDERRRIIALLEQADSACSPWAIALIKGENE